MKRGGIQRQPSRKEVFVSSRFKNFISPNETPFLSPEEEFPVANTSSIPLKPNAHSTLLEPLDHSINTSVSSQPCPKKNEMQVSQDMLDQLYVIRVQTAYLAQKEKDRHNKKMLSLKNELMELTISLEKELDAVDNGTTEWQEKKRIMSNLRRLREKRNAAESLLTRTRAMNSRLEIWAELGTALQEGAVVSLVPGSVADLGGNVVPHWNAMLDQMETALAQASKTDLPQKIIKKESYVQALKAVEQIPLAEDLQTVESLVRLAEELLLMKCSLAAMNNTN